MNNKLEWSWNYIQEFVTIELVQELFRRVNCIGSDNCFFLAFTNNQSPKAAMSGMVGGMIAASENRAWDAYLINATENGIGILPLGNKNPLFLKLENLNPQLEHFMFFYNNDIEFVKIRRLNFISPVAKSLQIKLKNGIKYNLAVRNKEKTIISLG